MRFISTEIYMRLPNLPPPRCCFITIFNQKFPKKIEKNRKKPKKTKNSLKNSPRCGLFLLFAKNFSLFNLLLFLYLLFFLIFFKKKYIKSKNLYYICPRF